MRSHPLSKIGRNDRCPCGSGEKYKRCCLEKARASEFSPWERQRQASDRLTDAVMKFATRRFGEEILDAWIDFNQTPFPQMMNKYEGEHQVFFPYFLFDWDPERPPQRRGRPLKPGVVARTFLAEKASGLTELERLILEQSIAQPVSFYEVVRCEPGHGMLLRDVLIGGESEVEEHTASRSLRPGDLVYAQVCGLPEVSALSRTGPIAIPPGMKAEVVALRAQLRRKIAKQNRDLITEDLIVYREKIRTVYLHVRDALRTPPRLTNTDSDPLLFHTLTFQVGSAQVAFDALAPLAWGMSKEDLLGDAEVDQDGALRSVVFDWIGKSNAMHETWDNTILGHMRISGRTLTVDVNSERRAGRIRAEIEKRLGLLAVLQGTRVKTPEQMIQDGKKGNTTLAAPADAENEKPGFDPGEWESVQAQMQEEVNSWVYRRIPVLGGRTPMEAVADPDGREIVEGFLLEWERENGRPLGPGMIRPDIGAMRRLLKL